ncbi:Uncharacterised protein [Citrobacter koseri]|nr:Uncharacterised protein [Citrobacter koseri]
MPPFLFLSARWRYAYRAYNNVCSVGRIRRSRHPALRPVALRLPGLQQRMLRRPDKAQPPSGVFFYSFGPALTSASPAGVSVYFSKFSTNSFASAVAFSCHCSGDA